MSSSEELLREKIVSQAKWHLNAWGGKWESGKDKLGSNKIAGKLCVDETTRERQGGTLISYIYAVAGHPQATRCLTISKAAVELYSRANYTAQERNNTDICSWCGIFALYIYKMAGLKNMPDWDSLKVYGVSTVPGTKKLLDRTQCHLATAGTPKRGDIGVIGARAVKDKDGKVIIKMGNNHHFIVTDVGNGSVETIDGNAGALMEIVPNSYSISSILKTGGFYTPIWENCS